MTVDELSAKLSAVASPQRIHILAALEPGRLHISELARRLNMSRALLYMHLAKLEEAGFIASSLELSRDGKALKFVSLLPFILTIDTPALVAAVAKSKEIEGSNAI